MAVIPGCNPGSPNDPICVSDCGTPLLVDIVNQPIEVTGLVTIDCGPTTDATVVTYSLANVTQTVAAANPDRRRIIFHNDGSAVLYLKYGLGATTTDHTIHLGANQIWTEEDYGGVITAVRGSAAFQDLSVTEIECV